MTRHPGMANERPTALWPRLIGVVCMLLAASGCANFWDEMLSSERDMSYATGWGKPDPLLVLKNSKDGVRRAQALGELKEPLQNKGTAKDQEMILALLATAAKDDREPICRLAAVRTLGKFHDARAARILEEVHQQQKMPFTPENNSMIRGEALVALEMTKDPEAWKFMIRIARAPAPAANSDLTDRQQTQDEKIVAIRALGNYRNQECLDALKYVMKTEKNVALRDRAMASLEQATNKKWPYKREDWQADKDVQPLPGVPGPTFIQQASQWIPWPL